MDVYHPEKPNGYGVVFISGSGWHAAQEYDAEPLKQGSQAQLYGPRRYRHEQLPQGPSWADVQRLLATTETDRRIDIRDRAVLLLFSVYGLRAGEVERIRLEDIAICQAIGRNGAVLVPDGKTVLTHCNAGALATAGMGTALAPIFTAHQAGKRIHVYVDETRPVLQGARLTAWELGRAGVPYTLIADNMAAHFLRRGGIRGVFVGSDRIAANGDVANKIGTYGLAILAREHGVPLYVVAPRSTVDLALPDGDAIPIEERAGDEITTLAGRRIAPADARVANPAFDVTPARYVAAIVTEAGVARPPYDVALAELMRH
jgi:eIF-2B alpha/beta/delta-like uncharacterized protein